MYTFTDKIQFKGSEYVVIEKENTEEVSILAIGDPHFKMDNLCEVDLFIDKIIQVIKDTTPTFVVVLGDLLHNHERLHTTVLNKAYEFINAVRLLCPVYVIVGNHDYINNTQFLSSNHWMNGMKEWSDVTIVDTGVVVNSRFVLCPYVYPGRFEEALNKIDKDWKTREIIFCHQEFMGCKMGAIVSEIGDIWNEEYPTIISGHIHNRQMPQHNIYYTGSSMQHAFGETHDKTISLCEFWCGDVIIKNIDLNLQKKKILYMSVDDVKDFILNDDNTDKIRITVKGTYSEFKTFKKSMKYKNLIKNGVKIIFSGRDIDSVEKDKYETESFNDILFDLVKDDKNMLELYNLLCLKKS